MMNGEKLRERIIDIFLVMILGIFPLVFHDYYFDILPTKYTFYYISALIMIVLVAGSWLLEKCKFGIQKGEKVFSKLWVVDWSILAFLASVTISTLLSKYPFAAFWGNEGRLTGLFLLLIYGAGYFAISRCWKLKNWYLALFLFSGMLVCIFGITDYFRMDLLGFKEHMVESQLSMFTSTMGNINTYTAYVALILAVAAVLFATAKKGTYVVLNFVCMCIAFLALIMGQSDNAYLSLLVLLGLLPLYLLGIPGGMKRYLIIVATFFSCIQGIDWVNHRFTTVGLVGIFGYLVKSDKLLWLVIGMWFLTAMSYIFDKKYPNMPLVSAKTGRGLWFALVVIIGVAVIGLLIDANFLGHADRYAAVKRYVVFDDSWGSDRGGIWRLAMENYLQFPWYQKLFGYGPETFAILLLENNKQEMWNMGGVLYDNAHNEYLQYLITLGAAGLVTYLSFIGSAAIRMVKRTKKNPYVMAILFALLCYWAQALVNINLPIVSPFMWVLLPMGLAASREDMLEGSCNV